jgi:hypothetical protein
MCGNKGEESQFEAAEVILMNIDTAMATAFPQPAPGAAPNPGPMVVPAGKLESVLGVTKVKVVRGKNHLAVVDSTLAEWT